MLLHRLVRKGWVRMIRVRPNRVRYLLTPAGIAEKARITQAYLRNTLSFYAQARNRIRERFDVLSATFNDLPGNGNGSGNGHAVESGEKRIVFYGAGEVAEIGYICLQETDLGLVAVVDDKATRFFNVPVYARSELKPTCVGERPYDRLVVMSFADAKALREKMAGLDIEESRLFWL
jgi:hypothetical protein